VALNYSQIGMRSPGVQLYSRVIIHNHYVLCFYKHKERILNISTISRVSEDGYP
jgi:hypothetical protein